MRLKPKSDETESRLERVVVTGKDRQIASFEVRERDGDTSVIRLLGAAPER